MPANNTHAMTQHRNDRRARRAPAMSPSAISEESLVSVATKHLDARSRSIHTRPARAVPMRSRLRQGKRIFDYDFGKVRLLVGQAVSLPDCCTHHFPIRQADSLPHEQSHSSSSSTSKQPCICAHRKNLRWVATFPEWDEHERQTSCSFPA